MALAARTPNGHASAGPRTASSVPTRALRRGLRCMPLLGGLCSALASSPFHPSAIPCRLAPCRALAALPPSLSASRLAAALRHRLLASPCAVVLPHSRACSPLPRWANSAPSAHATV